jgi:hypothetical protein
LRGRGRREPTAAAAGTGPTVFRARAGGAATFAPEGVPVPSNWFVIVLAAAGLAVLAGVVAAVLFFLSRPGGGGRED